MLALALFTSAAFPANLTGMTTVAISAVAPISVMPMPATAPLFLPVVVALALA